VILLSEFIFILRPVIYCNLMIIYGNQNYKALIVNFFIDVIWILFLIK